MGRRLAQQRDALPQVVRVGADAAHLQTAAADLLFQAADGPGEVVEATLDGCQVVVHGHDMTSLPWAGPETATFMRLRVLRVTPCAVKGCASIGRGVRVHSPVLCAARVGLAPVAAVSP